MLKVIFPYLHIELIFSSPPPFLFEEEHHHKEKNNGHSDADRKPKNSSYTVRCIKSKKQRINKVNSYTI